MLDCSNVLLQEVFVLKIPLLFSCCDSFLRLLLHFKRVLHYFLFSDWLVHLPYFLKLILSFFYLWQYKLCFEILLNFCVEFLLLRNLLSFLFHLIKNSRKMLFVFFNLLFNHFFSKLFFFLKLFLLFLFFYLLLFLHLLILFLLSFSFLNLLSFSIFLLCHKNFYFLFYFLRLFVLLLKELSPLLHIHDGGFSLKLFPSLVFVLYQFSLNFIT